MAWLYASGLIIAALLVAYYWGRQRGEDSGYARGYETGKADAFARVKTLMHRP